MAPAAYCFHRSFEAAAPAEFKVDRHYLLYARSGALRLEAEGLRWTLPPARAALIAAGQPISIAIPIASTTASVLFSEAMMAPPPRAVTVFDMSPLARELIAECVDYGPEGGALSVYAQSLFTALAQVVLRLAETPSPLVLPIPQSPALRRAMALTEAQAGSSPVFSDIARRTGQSPRALSRRFAKEMGMTWRQALSRIRMMRAVEQLAESHAPVSEIALSVGYNSLSAFNAAFRDLMGMTPSQYRESFRS